MGTLGRCTGYRQACEAAKERLALLALNHSENQERFRQDLLNIAKTTLRYGPLPLPAGQLQVAKLVLCTALQSEQIAAH